MIFQSPSFKNLIEETKRYFLFPGVLKCSPEFLSEQKQRFENALLEIACRYAEGKISAEKFSEQLKNEAEPLRKNYVFWKQRVSWRVI